MWIISILNKSFQVGEGWHSLPNSVFRINNLDSNSSSFLEAGSNIGNDLESPEASKLLGINRNTLRKKIKLLRIPVVKGAK